jgi:hypothetical protein
MRVDICTRRMREGSMPALHRGMQMVIDRCCCPIVFVLLFNFSTWKWRRLHPCMRSSAWESSYHVSFHCAIAVVLPAAKVF